MAPWFSALAITLAGVPGVAARLGQGSRFTASTCPATAVGQCLGSLQAEEIDECSGLAASRKNPGVYWLNNDSGEGPRLFAIDQHGAHRATLWVEGAEAIDWEDIAVGPGPDETSNYLYIADTGDNHKRRPIIQIYRGVEPIIPEGQDPHANIPLMAQRFDVSYPNGPHDCEAMFLDPSTDRIYIITKGFGIAEVHWVSLDDPAPLSFKKVGEIAVDLVTGADISPDGSLIAVRSYGDVLMWTRQKGTMVEDNLVGSGCRAHKADEQQGEAIAFGRRGDHYLTVSEGRKQPVWYFALEDSFYASMMMGASTAGKATRNGTAALSENSR